MSKPAVNAPCPCGSGKNYKKCCRNEATLTSTIAAADLKEGEQRLMREYNAHLNRRQSHVGHFGHVRRIVHGDFQGKKFVAVGPTIHASPEWKTMIDFLGDYIKMLFGGNWWSAEATKPREAAHPVLALARLAHQWMQSSYREVADLRVTTPDSAMFEYLALAYDLYILRHHSAIQGSLLKRLRLADQFKGARHEIFAAAAMLRANCELSFFREKKVRVKSPEFHARFAPTMESVAVEAKARCRLQHERREGTLGLVSLLRDAFKKNTGGQPLVIFIDLDLALEPTISWEDFIRSMHKDIEDAKGSPQAPDPFAMIVATSHRTVSGLPPDLNHREIVSTRSICSIRQEFRDAIIQAVAQRQNIPSHFEADTDLRRSSDVSPTLKFRGGMLRPTRE